MGEWAGQNTAVAALNIVRAFNKGKEEGTLSEETGTKKTQVNF